MIDTKTFPLTADQWGTMKSLLHTQYGVQIPADSGETRIQDVSLTWKYDGAALTVNLDGPMFEDMIGMGKIKDMVQAVIEAVTG